MLPIMFGPLALLAASALPAPASPSATGERASGTIYRQAATARATASVTIISGIRFGADQPAQASGADRREARLTEADGQVTLAKLLEFQ